MLGLDPEDIQDLDAAEFDRLFKEYREVYAQLRAARKDYAKYLRSAIEAASRMERICEQWLMRPGSIEMRVLNHVARVESEPEAPYGKRYVSEVLAVIENEDKCETHRETS